MLVDRSTWLGLLLAAGPLAVLAHGAFDAGSLVTGLLLATPIAALLVLGDWRTFSPTSCDALFGIFVACIAISLAWNGIGAEPNEFCLLVLTLAAYPAARLNGGHFFPMRGLLILAGAIVAAGTLATIPALLTQWSDHGKPMVFSQFDAAPAQFTTLLGFGLLVLANGNSSPRNALLASLLLTIPIAIFAASMVRYTILALLVTLAIGIILSPTSRRRLSATILAIVITATVAGTLARHEMTATFATQLVEAVEIEKPKSSKVGAAGTGRADGPSRASAAPAVQLDCSQIHMNNSVAIRRQLYRDAFRLLPDAGLFGFGLDRFIGLGCVLDTEVHNTFLQAAIEFGWIAGVALVLLTLSVSGAGMRKLARMSPEIRIALCGLTFTILLTLAHGRVSRDITLFLFLGYAAALKKQSIEIAAAWLIRGTLPWNSPESLPEDATTTVAAPSTPTACASVQPTSVQI
ncbi:O-antigen ligase family protein [Bradyrhizobium sp. BRP22]|uniref:O-antigen ligase family protein n=1 Tax=Bradyrhizobium sp. BRP22 TaxID=2793821 RepID=UPI001CD58619|nr:O-antigen ligase family protein [Bradyrhizobium sp. BRP22]